MRKSGLSVELSLFVGRDPVKDGWDDVGGMYAAAIEMHLIQKARRSGSFGTLLSREFSSTFIYTSIQFRHFLILS